MEKHFQDEAKQAVLMKFFYDMLKPRFLTLLRKYANGEGYGIENMWCVFASDYEPWEEDYFGETGIAYYFDYPAVEKDEIVILDYKTFYQYLKEESSVYLHQNMDKKEEIEELLLKVRERFNILE